MTERIAIGAEPWAAGRSELTDLILYATPSGPLGEQIDRFLLQTRELFGANAAHQYPAHCTLTGFFHDTPRAIPDYRAALEAAVAEALPQPPAAVTIDRIRLDGTWYGLELTSLQLIDLAAAFKRQAPSVTRPDDVRLKDWLHLSLAYEFEDRHAAELARVASGIDINANVQWEVALWQRDGSVWIRH